MAKGPGKGGVSYRDMGGENTEPATHISWVLTIEISWGNCPNTLEVIMGVNICARNYWALDSQAASEGDAIMGNGMKIGLSSSQQSDIGVSTMANFFTSFKLFHEQEQPPINLVSAIEIFQASQLLPAPNKIRSHNLLEQLQNPD